MIIKKYLPQYYVVKKGESLFEICEGFELDLNAIKTLNGIKKDVSEGDMLILQEISKNYYIVKPLDTLFSISKKLNVSVQDIIEKNNLQTDSVFIGQKLIY